MYGRSACSKFVQTLNILKKDAKDTQWYKTEAVPIANKLQQIFNTKDIPGWEGMCHTLQAIRDNNLVLPKGITRNLTDEVCNVAGKHLDYRYPKEMSRLAVGRFMDNLNQMLIQVKQNEIKTRFALICGHDNTVAPILSDLSINEQKIPDFGAAIYIELFQNKENGEHYIRVQYKNEVKRLKDCGNRIFCPFSEFQKIMDAAIPKDFEMECGVTNIKTSENDE